MAGLPAALGWLLLLLFLLAPVAGPAVVGALTTSPQKDGALEAADVLFQGLLASAEGAEETDDAAEEAHEEGWEPGGPFHTAA